MTRRLQSDKTNLSPWPSQSLLKPYPYQKPPYTNKQFTAVVTNFSYPIQIMLPALHTFYVRESRNVSPLE